MKLAHWSMMSELLHLVWRGWNWAGSQPSQASPRSTKCSSPPVNGYYTDHRIAVLFSGPVKGLRPSSEIGEAAWSRPLATADSLDVEVCSIFSLIG